jgi:predicted transcriptional regulator of viral defense system
VRTSQGLYELADADIAHSLAEVSKRVPKGVVCLISALQFHEITLQNPRSIWMAIGEKDRKPTVTHVAARFVRFGTKALTLGVETHRIDSVPVRIFEPAKTIVDCVRYRRIETGKRSAFMDAFSGHSPMTIGGNRRCVLPQ